MQPGRLSPVLYLLVKSRFASNVVQEKKFSELLVNVITRYQNRSIETVQVMEELIEMARKLQAAANRGEALGLDEDEIKFYDALATERVDRSGACRRNPQKDRLSADREPAAKPDRGLVRARDRARPAAPDGQAQALAVARVI